MGDGKRKVGNNVSLQRALLGHKIKRQPNSRLILLNKLLEDGNTLYRKNRLQEASHRYQYALKKIPSNPGTSNATSTTASDGLVPPTDSNNNTASNATFQQLKFNFLLNLSRCRRKMSVSTDQNLTSLTIKLKNHLQPLPPQDVAEAIELATQAIDIKPNAYDGYYARSKALMEYGNYGEALRDAGVALTKSHATSIEIRETLTRLHSDLQKRHMLAIAEANQLALDGVAAAGTDCSTRSSSVHSSRSIAESMDIITDL